MNINLKTDKMQQTPTPITEAIQNISYMWALYEDFTNDLYLKIVDSLKELLPKEKEVIENAFVAGDERGTKDIPFNCEQYFSQTYIQTTK